MPPWTHSIASPHLPLLFLSWISTSPYPSGLPGWRSAGLHNLRRDRTPQACQACSPQALITSTGTMPLKPATHALNNQDLCSARPAPQPRHACDPKARRNSTRPTPSAPPGPCSTGPLDGLNHRLPPAGPWGPTHLPPTTGGL
jgi:hypothetical protein